MIEDDIIKRGRRKCRKWQTKGLQITCDETGCLNSIRVEGREVLAVKEAVTQKVSLVQIEKDGKRMRQPYF